MRCRRKVNSSGKLVISGRTNNVVGKALDLSLSEWLGSMCIIITIEPVKWILIVVVMHDLSPSTRRGCVQLISRPSDECLLDGIMIHLVVCESKLIQ